MSFTLTHNAEAVSARIRVRGSAMRESLQECFAGIALDLQRAIQNDALEGQILHHRTGKLKGSIRQTVEWSGSYTGAGPFTISAIVQGGGGVAPYGILHEYGMVVPEHGATRRKETWLTHVAGIKRRQRRHSHLTSWLVREFQYPERSFMRSTMHAHEAQYLAQIERAIGEGISK